MSNESITLDLAAIYAENKKPVISFEVFPPKTDLAYEHLLRILPELAALRPDFMTVTYGALGSTRERTLEIATLIKNRFDLPVACHLTCVNSSKADLDKLLRDIHAAGIRNIVALRGDPPKGQTDFVPPPDGYAHANELVTHIRAGEKLGKFGPFGIAVAGYPEKHVEAPDLDTDLENLKRKVQAGANCVITQLFYDNQAFFRFVEKARRAGISVPIIPGLMPVLSAKQIVTITKMCGASLPADFLTQLHDAGEDGARSEQVGIRQCVAQARELVSHGVPGIHFYVLNKAAHIGAIMAGLSR